MRIRRCWLARPLAVVGLAAAAACSSTPGTHPHDMSASQHEAAAAGAERLAELHAAQYDAGASVHRRRCGPRGGCWTSIVNPTAEHLEQAEKYRHMAADHRAALQALREAETRACAGLADDDRDMSPFAHREDLLDVDPLTETVSTSKGPSLRVVGAVITFRALPGMTTPWLQRVVDCHLARNAALGHVDTEMPDCPLVPKDVSAHVRQTDAGFAVDVRSDDSATAAEILRRARTLAVP
jgi:hypothetical protein